MKRALLGGPAVALLAALSLSSCQAPRTEPEPEAATPTVAAPSAAAPQAATPGFRAEWVRRLMRPEQAPALERPRALPARGAPLRGQERVIGVSLDGGHARAYPLNVLAYHRVVNDLLAGARVTVAHSPLSGATLCLRGAARLQHSGAVHESDDVLVEAGRPGARWSVLLGRRVAGEGAGGAVAIPCVVTSWRAWRTLRPSTDVVWPARPVLGFDYRQDPWTWYRADPGHLVAPVHYVDLRLPQKQPVLGLPLGGRAAAFPLPARGRRVLNTRAGGQPLLVVLDETGLGAAYRRRVDGRALRFVRAGALLEDELTRSRWNLLGESIAGPLAGKRLERVDGGVSLFFAWAAHHPGTSIDGSKDEQEQQLATRRDDDER